MKIKKTTVTRDQYEVECTQCGKKIIGNSEANILYNLDIHINAIHKNERRARASERSGPNSRK